MFPLFWNHNIRIKKRGSLNRIYQMAKDVNESTEMGTNEGGQSRPGPDLAWRPLLRSWVTQLTSLCRPFWEMVGLFFLFPTLNNYLPPEDKHADPYLYIHIHFRRKIDVHVKGLLRLGLFPCLLWGPRSLTHTWRIKCESNIFWIKKNVTGT